MKTFSEDGTVCAWKHETHDEAIKFLPKTMATAERKTFLGEFRSIRGIANE